MDEDVLRQIGLTESEIKVYLALLQLKDASRSAIVAESGIAGSKIYDVLERLQKKGLVSIYYLNTIKHFKAISPMQIIDYLDEKQENIEKAKRQIENAMPRLMQLFMEDIEEQEIELMSGTRGLSIIFKEQVEMLKPGEICYVIGGTKGSDEGDVLAFFEKVHLWREKKGIKTKMLFNIRQKASTEKHYSNKKYPYSETRYIKHTSPVAINFWADRTAILIFGKKTSAIYIKSKDVSKSFKEYFQLLWDTSR